MPRKPQQPTFSDIRIDSTEMAELAQEIIVNQPTDEEIERGKKRRAATKKLKDKLKHQFRAECEAASRQKAYMNIGDIALVKPNIIERQEEKKTVVFYPGGRTDLAVEIKPASWQLAFGIQTPEILA